MHSDSDHDIAVWQYGVSETPQKMLNVFFEVFIQIF